MIDNVNDAILKRDNPEVVAQQVERGYSGERMRLSQLFVGEEMEIVRQQIKQRGYFHSAKNGKTLHVQTQQVEGSDDPEVIAIAAVSRDPGKTQDYIDAIQDFKEKTGGTQRATQIKQYWEMYKTEGIVNNAVNKYAALLSGGGRAKVRFARKGKKQDAILKAQQILDFWVRNVNASSDFGVVTGARGIKALTEQGFRVAMVEGDFMARQVWSQADVPDVGSVSLPMTIQVMSMEFMEPVAGLQGIGELWYWKPSSDLAKLIQGQGGSDVTKEVKDVIKRLFPNDESKIVQQVKKNGKALLSPALLCHARHRGSDREPYGESFIEPAKLGIRYSRAVTAGDMVSVENIINQIMVVMVGSSDPASPYSKADVAAARAGLMQSFFEEPSPNMTIVWQGDDVKVEVVGAKNQLPDFESRHKVGENKIILALGIPSALLSGVTSDGKSAGWASMLSASGQAEHMQGAFAIMWTQLCERILIENGYVDLDITFEFDRSTIGDRSEERNQNRLDYTAGLMSIKNYIASTGRDPDAEFLQKCTEKGLDPTTTTWETAFMPPVGLPGQGPNGAPPGTGPGAGQGRPTDSVSGKPAAPPAEKKKPVENK